jgi:hypothetical protein
MYSSSFLTKMIRGKKKHGHTGGLRIAVLIEEESYRDSNPPTHTHTHTHTQEVFQLPGKEKDRYHELGMVGNLKIID